MMAESKAKKPAAKPAAKDAAVNMRGLKCPLPTLKTRKLLSRMTAGEVLVLECTDPLTTIDVPNLIRDTSDILESSGQRYQFISFLVACSLSFRNLR
jgi:tRNA 2-thiouridine synthesizing protein A